MLPLLLLSPLLAATAICDLRLMRIPHLIVGLVVALFIVTAPFQLGLSDGLARLAVATAVLVVGMIGFSLRLLGGGDVKILAALMLFVPGAVMPVFMLLFAAALLLGTAGVVIARRLIASPTSAWAFLRDKRRFPMGISIAGAGLALPWVVLAMAG